MNLYLVVGVLAETDEESMTILMGPNAVAAKDEMQAAVKARSLVPRSLTEKEENRLEIRVMPFRGCK